VRSKKLKENRRDTERRAKKGKTRELLNNQRKQNLLTEEGGKARSRKVLGGNCRENKRQCKKVKPEKEIGESTGSLSGLKEGKRDV